MFGHIWYIIFVLANIWKYLGTLWNRSWNGEGFSHLGALFPIAHSCSRKWCHPHLNVWFIPLSTIMSPRYEKEEWSMNLATLNQLQISWYPHFSWSNHFLSGHRFGILSGQSQITSSPRTVQSLHEMHLKKIAAEPVIHVEGNFGPWWKGGPVE